HGARGRGSLGRARRRDAPPRRHGRRAAPRRCRAPSAAAVLDVGPSHDDGRARAEERRRGMSGPLAVVTGCAGFVGSHLVERLVADGWRVRGVDAFTDYYPRAEKEANVAAVVGDAAFELLELDLSSDALEPLLADRPVVFHLAAQPGVRGSFGEGFAIYVRDNVLATQRLLEAAAVMRSGRVVWASSSSVYGDAAAYPCRARETPT